MKQTHHFYGPIVVRMSQAGMHVDQLKWGTCFIQKTGEDVDYIYSARNKAIFLGHGGASRQMIQFEFVANLASHSSHLFDWQHLNLKKVKTAPHLGLKSEEYIGQSGDWRWEIWTTRALGLPDWMSKERCLWARLPNLNAIPLEATLINKNGEKIAVLSTQGLRKIKPEQVSLSYPAGLTRVNNVSEVMSSESATFIQDLQDTLGK